MVSTDTTLLTLKGDCSLDYAVSYVESHGCVFPFPEDKLNVSWLSYKIHGPFAFSCDKESSTVYYDVWVCDFASGLIKDERLTGSTRLTNQGLKSITGYTLPM